MHLSTWGLVRALARYCLGESSTCMPTVNEKELVTFDVAPGGHRHWRLAIDGRVATLAMDVNEDCGLRPGYKLKLNSRSEGTSHVRRGSRRAPPLAACHRWPRGHLSHGRQRRLRPEARLQAQAQLPI